jgi:hypothetical protein
VTVPQWLSPAAGSVYCGKVRASPQRLVDLVHLGAGLLLAILTGAGTARAQDAQDFVFSWQAPAGCPGSMEVRTEIARLLGGSIGNLPGGRLQARAVVTQGQTWAVVLETESLGNVGQRSLETDSCRELANATALIIALMIDPEAVAAHSAPPPPPPPRSPEPASQPTSRPEYTAGIIVAGNQGALPSPDVGLGGTLGVAGQGWRVDVRASYGLRRDQKARAPLPAGGYGQFNFTSALLAGCLNLGSQRAAWGPCAVAEFGVVSAKGVGVNRSLPAQVPWWALGAGAYAAIQVTRRWAIPIHLDALLPLRRSEYAFRDSQGNLTARVFKAAPVGVRVSGGVELRF